MSGMNNYSIENIRKAWLETGLAQWRRQIVDERNSEEIVKIFESVGWGWWLTSEDHDGYRDTETFAWCGHFQSYCGLNLGHHLEGDRSVPVMLDREIAQTVLPSTQRVVSERKWRQAGYDEPSSIFQPDQEGEGWVDTSTRERRAAADVLLPGTIATIASRDYGDYRDEVGGHFVCIERLDGDTVETVEGNAEGELFSGDWGEGVVRRRGNSARNLGDFRRVIHFDTNHFDYISSV